MGTNTQRSGHKLRWYPMRALRIALGKHGLTKLRERMGMAPLHKKVTR